MDLPIRLSFDLSQVAPVLGHQKPVADQPEPRGKPAVTWPLRPVTKVPDVTLLDPSYRVDLVGVRRNVYIPLTYEDVVNCTQAQRVNFKLMLAQFKLSEARRHAGSNFNDRTKQTAAGSSATDVTIPKEINRRMGLGR